ncbi:LruC domain-containing protein [Sphingobacterium faecium NBRC 15299]|uniref:LruC domain-containing protein n=1 Tax=Sphingobacterium faecium TaxID=34087 RepID=UPI000D36F3AF|nr:LruC domain-containing protein [Sphingobacterium faecium]PTX12424.1 LruC domain-containing protein [Sphingobacterium faecium]GEM62132.1 LruC domain-containing protein [Sphingobacterium faecium NBRC 15299]
MYQGKRFHLFLVSLVAITLIASSCSKVKDLYEEPDTDSSTLFPDGSNVPSDFKWNSAQSMDIRVAVDDKFDGQYFYRVEIFDNDPLLGQGANLLAAGQAKKGQDFVGKLMLPTMAKYLYLRETSPLGIASVTMIAVDPLKSNIQVAPTSSSSSNRASVARASINTTISNTNSATVSALAATPVVVPNDAVQISGNTNVVVEANKSYVVKTGTTFTGQIDANNGTSNVKIYVQGTWKNSSFEFNLGSNNSLYITDAGSIDLVNVTQNTNGGFVNYGTASLSKMETKNTTLYVNYGTLNANKADITNGSFTNYGVATIQELVSTTNSTVIRNEGTLTVKNANLTNATLEAVCHTTIQSLTTNGAMISISSGALLSLDKLDAGGTKFNLASSSILAVNNLAKFNSQASTMQGPSSGQALARMKKVDVNNQYMAITYSGNLEVASSDHTANGQWNTYYVLNSPAKLVPYDKSTVVIAGTACNAGGNNAPGGNPNDQTVTEVNLGTYSYAFEDNWPNKGDYDMNDFVVDMNITKFQNTANKVTKVTLKGKLRSVGASKRLAAAIQLDGVPAGNVKSVTYSKKDLVGANLALAANGTETGQTNAVVAIVDDAHKAFGVADTRFISTQSGAYAPVDVVITIEFTTPLDNFSYNTLNMFIVNYAQNVGGRNEIHLVGYAATDKINKSIVSRESGKLLSATDPFKTIKNEPFALALPVSFKYPTEGQKVYDAYPLFKDWVTSGGLQNANWYLNK